MESYSFSASTIDSRGTCLVINKLVEGLCKNVEYGNHVLDEQNLVFRDLLHCNKKDLFLNKKTDNLLKKHECTSRSG